MGAWGEEPYANDAACDWFIGALVEGPLVRNIETALNSPHEEQVRAAAFLLEKIGYGYVYPSGKREDHIELATRRLRGLLEDEAWINDWRDPDEIRGELRRQIDALRVRLNREDENILMRRIREGQGEPKTSVYDVLDWALGQLSERYEGHAEGDLPVEYRVGRAILKLREQEP